jgi:hypothetical protein
VQTADAFPSHSFTIYLLGLLVNGGAGVLVGLGRTIFVVNFASQK